MTNPYAAAWLSEMWPTVREHHDHRPRVHAPKSKGPRQPCPECGTKYSRDYLPDHIVRIHTPPRDVA